MTLCRFGPPGRRKPGIVDAQGAVSFAEIVAGLASRVVVSQEHAA